MRLELGLDLPELRVGLWRTICARTGAPEVVLSRAAKQAGAPTVRSRFVQRLAAVAGETRWKQALRRGARYTDYARALDHPAKVSADAAAGPVPPPEARPSQLSVTDIENWLRDPYTIYAKHVLRLFPLDAIDTPPGAADLEPSFMKRSADSPKNMRMPCPPMSGALLQNLARSISSRSRTSRRRAPWWTRFVRVAA